MPPPRYSTRPLPSYRYLPGRTARPTDTAHGSDTFEHAIDLHNAGFYWEAHEAFETLWQAKAPSAERSFLQALIQISAACLKRVMDSPGPAESIAKRALVRLSSAPDHCLGVDVRRLESDACGYFQGDRIDPPIISLTNAH